MVILVYLNIYILHILLVLKLGRALPPALRRGLP